MKITISAVLPTRCRPASLERALAALAAQQRLPEEVIVADASEPPIDGNALAAAHRALAVTCFHAAPSVCAQRNAAVRRARSSHVLLCDDDMELPPEYVHRLASYAEQHPTTGAVSGIICEPDADGRFTDHFDPPSFRQLLIGFAAQRTIWGDVEATRGTAFAAPLLALLKSWYRSRGNTWSLAGWPLVTQVRTPVVHTAIYGLGAALIRRDWLLASPYDEALGPHGIGDNYGVALGFPGDQAITLLTDLRVRHHRVSDGRLDPVTAYFQRILALHYFMRRSPRFSGFNIVFLIWSLLANAFAFGIRGHRKYLRATTSALRLILTRRNPLLTIDRRPPERRAGGD